jgi:hypothetical protein
MNRFPRSTMGAFLLGISTLVPAAVENVAEPPEEITVTGKSMAAARSELHRAQEQVFTVFNSLNSDDEYDIHCESRASTGSHIKRRVCEANFVGDATSAEAMAFLMRRGAVPAWAVILRKKKLLHMEMVRVAEAHPEFLAALEELAAAHDRAESLQQKRRAGR